MFHDAFAKLDILSVEDLIPRINALAEGAPFDPTRTTIMAIDLPFYRAGRLLDVSDHSLLPVRKVFAIEREGAVTMLDWTNGPIYQLNKTVPIKLDQKTIPDYLRFFFSFVRGRHGRFLVVESVEDITWTEDPSPATRKALSDLIEPLTLRSLSPGGEAVVAARILFKRALFKCAVTVGPDGTVTMGEEDLVLEDLPVADDIMG